MDPIDRNTSNVYDEALNILRTTGSFEKVRTMLNSRGVDKEKADAIVRMIDKELINEHLSKESASNSSHYNTASLVALALTGILFVIGLMNGYIVLAFGLLGVGGGAVYLGRKRFANSPLRRRFER